MKIPVFFPLLFIASMVHSQTNDFPPDGSVGIGTSDPISLLHLKGDDPDLTLDINSTSTLANSPELRFSLDGMQKAAVFWSKLDEKLYMRNNDHLLVITPSGRVGIGTSAPGAAFHVFSPGDVGKGNVSSSIMIGRTNGPEIQTIQQSFDPDPQSLAFRVKSSSAHADSNFEAMRIHSSGNVGIGTTDPSAKLEVSGSPNNATVVLSNENLVGFKRADGALVYGIGHTNSEFTIGATTNLGPTAGTPIHIAAGSSSAQIKFSQNTHERMRIASNGYVGIGTTSPDAKLTVKGDIHAEEVRVDLNVPGPDYVFDEDYDLPTLESLQNYIREHKHLPEIPSAMELEENGIDLGVMNMLLLKKVEELTLHLIELDSRNRQQDEKIGKLESELKKVR